MKKVEAIIKPFKLDDVKDALHEVGVSGLLGNADAWKGVIIDGALKDSGMVSFAKVLTPQDAEAIRAYVVDRSIWTKANLADTAAPMGR